MKNDRLRLASVEITRRCNNACPYCDQPKTEQDMPVAQFASLLDALSDQGVEAVALGGGEPTLHPALPALLEAAGRRGLHVGLTTNARVPDLVARLADRGLLDSFGVSAGKGEWTALAGHPVAVVNLLLLAGRLPEVTGWAVAALHHGARRLLLLGYKGDQPAFAPTTAELAAAFALLTGLGERPARWSWPMTIPAVGSDCPRYAERASCASLSTAHAIAAVFRTANSALRR